MSYANAAYWQAQANRCTEFADEGACLARVSEHAPVTIVPGFSGLGQIDGLTTLAARSPDIMAVQTALIHAGALTIRTADGVISATSPTLAAIRSWATANGLSSTGTARTSTGGLVIPSSLLARILAITTAAPADSSVKISPDAPVSSTLPEVRTDVGMPRWLPWVAGATALTVLGISMMAGGGVAARFEKNPRRRSKRRRRARGSAS